MLKGKSAIVTGSTSGIGLGIAHALAAEGASIMLNGFGDAAQINRQCEQFATKFKVDVAFSGADMSRSELGLTKVVALETAQTGVTCNAICPGWVLTPLVQKQIDDLAARDKIPGARPKELLLAEKQPSREFASPEQIGALAAFLCSDAAAQIRGASITVDGGWTAQ